MRLDKKKLLQFVYEITLAIVIFAGILDRAGIFTQNLQLHTLYSFTTISNGCVMVIMLFAALVQMLPPVTAGSVLARVRFIGVIMILITGTVYHFILLPQKIIENPSYQVFSFGNIIAHYFAPIGVLADWLLFCKKGLVTKREPLICVLVSVLYFIITTLYGFYGSTIPGKETSYVYFFMDVGELGIVGVIKWVAVIFAAILLLVYSLYAIDRILAKRIKGRT